MERIVLKVKPGQLDVLEVVNFKKQSADLFFLMKSSYIRIRHGSHGDVRM